MRFLREKRRMPNRNWNQTSPPNQRRRQTSELEKLVYRELARVSPPGACESRHASLIHQISRSWRALPLNRAVELLETLEGTTRLRSSEISDFPLLGSGSMRDHSFQEGKSCYMWIMANSEGRLRCACGFVD